EADPILLSDSVASGLPAAEFTVRPWGVHPAKGFGPLALHRLLWRTEDRSRPPVRPYSLPPNTTAPGTQAVHALTLDRETGRGRVVVVRARVSVDGSGLVARQPADAALEAIAAQAIQAAF